MAPNSKAGLMANSHLQCWLNSTQLLPRVTDSWVELNDIGIVGVNWALGLALRIVGHAHTDAVYCNLFFY